MRTIVLLLFAHISMASSLSVSPTYFEIDKPGGQSLAENIVVFNSSNQNMRVLLNTGDFWYDRSGKRTFPHPGSSPRSAANWIAISQLEVEVPAKGQVTVPFVLAVPSKAPTSAYASLFVEKHEGKGASKGEVNVGVSLRIAVPILYRRPDIELSKLSLKSFSLLKPSSFKPLLLKFQLVNEDEAYVFPEGNVILVKGPEKQFVAKSEIKGERVILPQQKLPYEVALAMTPKPGKYEGLLTLFYGNNKNVVQNFSFSIP